MNIQYGVKRTIIRPSHTAYCMSLLAFVYTLDWDYATKMRYNVEKDLVFVQKPSGLWGTKEHVYEVHHLEQMVPATMTGVKHMGFLQKNGIMTVKDMAQDEVIRLYNDKKYWNPDLRKEFIRETTGLWKDTFKSTHGGRTGHIFNTEGHSEEHFMKTMQKVNEELVAAREKYGDVKKPTNTYPKQFYDRIDLEKSKIVGAQ